MPSVYTIQGPSPRKKRGRKKKLSPAQKRFIAAKKVCRRAVREEDADYHECMSDELE